jgi:hypothetical protein
VVRFRLFCPSRFLIILMWPLRHATSDQGSFCPGLPRNVMQCMRRARSRLDDASVPPARWNNDSVQVWMSHKPPVSYPTFPYKGTVTVTKRPDYVIGR